MVNHPSVQLKRPSWQLETTASLWTSEATLAQFFLSPMLSHTFCFSELCEVSVKPFLHSVYSLSSLLSTLSPSFAALPNVQLNCSFKTISSSFSGSVPLPL